ncbi:MAG: tetratricopeptide repeat protein [Deltaproteobacteria bacterium]|nr:MAG: tetratricopeptide repeat protein [Deltaproteobacteria bacterium]
MFGQGEISVSRQDSAFDRAKTQPADHFAVRGVRSPLVGRDAELAAMRDALATAVDFQAPQIVTVIGNQGTGKTRLVAELIERHVAPPVRVFCGRSSQNGPKHEALATYLRDRFAIKESDPRERQMAVFRREVEAVFGDARIGEVLHFLGGFLDLHFPDSPFLRVLKDNPEQHAEIARTVLRRFIEMDAARSPLVMVFDDLQWADDDTLRLLREVAAGLGGSAVVLIACTRPDMLIRCPQWADAGTDHLRIELRNLPDDAAEDMFRKLLARCGDVPEDIVEDAVEMTGGNPYFLEELVRLFLANGTIDATGERWALDPDKAAATELPISIEEAIEARIAALEAAERDVLEKGAVFGHVFWTGAIVAMQRIEAHERERAARADSAPVPPRPNLSYEWTAESEPIRYQVERIIDDLVERDYLLRLEPEDSTIAGDVELVFKHNLERELVAKSTEPSRRARYHRVAGQWLEARLSDRSEEQLEFLAQLYERGGDRRRAARCYLAGGDKARARYANAQAVELYTRGLAMLEDDDALARLEALHNLGDVLDLVGRTDEALARFSEMLQAAWLFDNQAKAGAAHGRLGRIYRRRGEYDRAMDHLREAHRLFERARDQRGVAGALDDIGRVHWLRGQYAQALNYYRQALAIRRALGDRRSIALSLANIGRVHRDSGAFKAAVEQFREALDLRRDAGDMQGVVQSLVDLGGVHADDDNFEMALDLLREGLTIAVDIGDKLAEAQVLSLLAECEGNVGHVDDALAHLARALELARALSDRATLAESHRRLAAIHLAAGDAAKARDEADRALRLGESIGSAVHVGTAHRVLGAVLAAGPLPPADRAATEEHFRKAVDILGELNNAIELARCYRAYAAFRERCGDAASAAELRRRADEIFGRLRGAAAVE